MLQSICGTCDLLGGYLEALRSDSSGCESHIDNVDGTIGSRNLLRGSRDKRKDALRKKAGDCKKRFERLDARCVNTH